MNDAARTPPSGTARELERADAHAREGGAKGEGGLGRSAAVGHGARVRVRARARVSMAATVEGAGADRSIAVPTMMCTRPKPIAVALIGTSQEVVSTLAVLRRGDLVEVEGELTAADLGDQGAQLAVLVAAAWPVGADAPEVAHEG